MNKKYIYFLFIFFFSVLARANLTSCSPSSCSPACDSSCTYYSCAQTINNSFTVSLLPYNTYNVPGGACSDSMSGVVLSLLPFVVDGNSYNSLPASVNHTYKICKAFTNFGPACPPPPPPPPPIPPGP